MPFRRNIFSQFRPFLSPTERSGMAFQAMYRAQARPFRKQIQLTLSICLLLLLTASCHIGRPISKPLPVKPAPEISISEKPIESLAEQRPRIRIVQDESTIYMELLADAVCKTSSGNKTLPPGEYTVSVRQAAPAQQQFHLFTKTFFPSELNEANAYMAEMRGRGFEPRLVTFGKRLKSRSGVLVDTRTYRVSVARCSSRTEAESQKKELESAQVWAAIVPETIRPGSGTIILADKSGRPVVTASSSLTIEPSGLFTIKNVNFGFWNEQRAHRTYQADIEIGIGPAALLTLDITTSLDNYLSGVLPAEMPASWPSNALKAQTVAARSEIIASLATTHSLDGYDFCATEHCRAYAGEGGEHPASDAAVAETSGEVLVMNGRVLNAVFSATCGGWTEDNENVWAAPPNPALRASSDTPNSIPPPEQYGLDKWLTTRPDAFCDNDEKYYRWTRSFTVSELTDLVNKKIKVGTVQNIELGDRGTSGRLKWIRIIGSAKTETVRKELEIRSLFGGLPSAAFILKTDRATGPAKKFTLIGAGRGHGVGLCQYGARGMALQNFVYKDILKHYYKGVEIVRFD